MSGQCVDSTATVYHSKGACNMLYDLVTDAP